MANYNFTPTLNGLNNIDADYINSSSINTDLITSSTLTGNLTNSILTDCITLTVPTTISGIVNKSYCDNNFVD